MVEMPMDGTEEPADVEPEPESAETEEPGAERPRLVKMVRQPAESLSLMN